MLVMILYVAVLSHCLILSSVCIYLSDCRKARLGWAKRSKSFAGTEMVLWYWKGRFWCPSFSKRISDSRALIRHSFSGGRPIATSNFLTARSKQKKSRALFCDRIAIEFRFKVNLSPNVWRGGIHHGDNGLSIGLTVITLSWKHYNEVLIRLQDKRRQRQVERRRREEK